MYFEISVHIPNHFGNGVLQDLPTLLSECRVQVVAILICKFLSDTLEHRALTISKF